MDGVKKEEETEEEKSWEEMRRRNRDGVYRMREMEMGRNVGGAQE
jgi:hypothetical protein